MTGYVIRRLLALVPLLLVVSFVVFALSFLVGGNPAQTLAGGENATPESIAKVEAELNFDKPWYQQYGIWLANVARGDLGDSLLRNRSVVEEIEARFPVTLSITLGAMAVTVLLGVPLGLIAGTRPGSIADRICTFTTSVGIAMPDFWLATILVGVFAVQLQWFPYSQRYVEFQQNPYEWARQLFLPWIALGVAGAAGFARQLRGALIDALDQDYIRTARSKGLRGGTVVFKHALKNAAIAPITVLGLQFAYMLGGTVLIENIFGLNGMGKLFYTALVEKDLPVIQGVTLLVAVIFVLVNLLVDVVYAMVNPKVRYT